jgi:hypothetical protein
MDLSKDMPANASVIDRIKHRWKNVVTKCYPQRMGDPYCVGIQWRATDRLPYKSTCWSMKANWAPVAGPRQTRNMDVVIPFRKLGCKKKYPLIDAIDITLFC